MITMWACCDHDLDMGLRSLDPEDPPKEDGPSVDGLICPHPES